MKALTISEPLCLTKTELLELSRSLTLQIAELPEGSVEWRDAVGTLASIRIVLARLEFPSRGRGFDSPAV